MKKYVLCSLLCMLCLFMGGCMNAELNCGIDEDYNAYLKMDIEMDLKDAKPEDQAAIRISMQELADYYQDTLGYEVEANLYAQEDALQIHTELLRSADSYPEAFDKLKEMLTDEKLTPFTSVNMSRSGGNFEQGYKIKVQMSADQVLQTAYLENLSQESREYFEHEIEQSTAVLQITLPATEVVEHSGSIEQNVAFASAKTDISLKEQTELNLITRASIAGGNPVPAGEPDPMERMNAQISVAKIVAGLCAALGILCVILAIVFLVRSHRRDGSSYGE